MDATGGASWFLPVVLTRMPDPIYANAEEALAATDDFYAMDGFAYTEEMVERWIRANVQVPSAGNILDLCCGDGIWSRGFQIINPSLKLFGIDISQGAIDKARGLLRDHDERFVVGDAERGLPWPEESFEFIFARGPGLYNQHSMDRPATMAVIESWHRALAPGGRLLSIFSSNPKLLGSYTPMHEAKLPYNRAPRRTDAVEFTGGKYHHTIQSFLTPFWKAEGVEVREYRFAGNLHILTTGR